MKGAEAIVLHVADADAEKRGGFARMRGEHVAGAQKGKELRPLRQGKERVGVDHHGRAMGKLKQRFGHVCGPAAASESRAEYQRSEGGQGFGQRLRVFGAPGVVRSLA